VAQLFSLGTLAMHWNKSQVENFFGAAFTSADTIHEMRFDVGRLRYYLILDESKHFMALHADSDSPDSAFPAIELQFDCSRIEQTEASGVGPVLLFFASSERVIEHLRLCVTRTKHHTFSLSPHWQKYEPGA
jgi:hypothetical protein